VVNLVPDILQDGLTILFCGINPGLYSAAVGHNFARPGNRFWRTLYAAGITDRLLEASEEYELLKYGCGITNFVARATASAADLSAIELREGAKTVVRKVRRYKPRCLAIVGIGAYRTAFERPKAQLGLQQEKIGSTILWVLPNPSGLNAHYQLPELTKCFTELRQALNR